MRLFIPLLLLSTLCTGCSMSQSHSVRKYDSCAGCDGFDAPVMKGHNRKEVRELRSWYRQLNREETLARRNPRGGGHRGGSCPSCGDGFSEGGFCGQDGCGSEFYGDDYSMGHPQTGYVDGYSNNGWQPTGQDLNSQGDSNSTFCPHCQKQQPNYPQQFEESPHQEYQQYDEQMISPPAAMPGATPTVPTPMEEEVAPGTAPDIDTSYVPSDYYSPPPISIPAALPTPMMNNAQPVKQTLWAPSR